MRLEWINKTIAEPEKVSSTNFRFRKEYNVLLFLPEVMLMFILSIFWMDKLFIMLSKHIVRKYLNRDVRSLEYDVWDILGICLLRTWPLLWFHSNIITLRAFFFTKFSYFICGYCGIQSIQNTQSLNESSETRKHKI